eukprot:5721106-Pleurochrysis_carterae.AAC.2
MRKLSASHRSMLYEQSSPTHRQVSVCCRRRNVQCVLKTITWENKRSAAQFRRALLRSAPDAMPHARDTLKDSLALITGFLIGCESARLITAFRELTARLVQSKTRPVRKQGARNRAARRVSVSVCFSRGC